MPEVSDFLAYFADRLSLGIFFGLLPFLFIDGTTSVRLPRHIPAKESHYRYKQQEGEADPDIYGRRGRRGVYEYGFDHRLYTLIRWFAGKFIVEVIVMIWHIRLPSLSVFELPYLILQKHRTGFS